MRLNISFLWIAIGLISLTSCKENKTTQSTDTTAVELKDTIQTYGGAMLYTVREEMGKNPKQTLAKVADMGYSYVEVAGYDQGKFYGMSPEDFKMYLDSIGLTAVSSHHGSLTLDNADEQIADAKAAGFEYIVIPVPPMGRFTYDNETQTMGMKGDLEFLTKAFDSIGKKSKEAGLSLLYHNHDFEFKPNEDGVKPMDYFLENTNPEWVNFQLDLYWITKAGSDPLAYFEKYPGRFKTWHVKDMGEDGNFAPVGTGTIDFATILDHKEESGMQYYFVEQDKTFDRSPLEALELSHENLGTIGFK